MPGHEFLHQKIIINKIWWCRLYFFNITRKISTKYSLSQEFPMTSCFHSFLPFFWYTKKECSFMMHMHKLTYLIYNIFIDYLQILWVYNLTQLCYIYTYTHIYTYILIYMWQQIYIPTLWPIYLYDKISNIY